MANITVSAPIHKFMQSSGKRDMQDLLTIPLPFAAFTHTLTKEQWRKAAKFTSTKATAISALVKTTTGYAIILNHDGTYGSTGEATPNTTAKVGAGSPNSFVTVDSKLPPADNKPSFYAVYPCDASGNLSGGLTFLSLQSNQLTSFDGTGLGSLTSLTLDYNQLTSFDGTGLSSLTSASIGFNQLTSFDGSGLSELTFLNLQANQLTSFSGSGLSKLTGLRLEDNQFTSFDGTGLGLVSYLYLHNNQLTSFDGTGLGSLTEIKLGNNQLTSFIVGDLKLYDRFNYFTALDLSNQQLGVDALNTIYADLPDGGTYNVGYSNTIDVTGNPGAGAGSGTDPSVAQAKGWDVDGDVL